MPYQDIKLKSGLTDIKKVLSNMNHASIGQNESNKPLRNNKSGKNVNYASSKDINKHLLKNSQC